MVDLALGERRVAGTRDGDVRCHEADLPERVRADELALAVEVGANDYGVGLLGEVLERADDLLLDRLLLDGCPDEVGQAWDLPALDVDAIGDEGLALALVWWPLEGIGNVGGKVVAVSGETVPALLRVVLEIRWEVRLEDVPAQAYGHPVIATVAEAIDGRVVDLVGGGLA